MHWTTGGGCDCPTHMVFIPTSANAPLPRARLNTPNSGSPIDSNDTTRRDAKMKLNSTILVAALTALAFAAPACDKKEEKKDDKKVDAKKADEEKKEEAKKVEEPAPTPAPEPAPAPTAPPAGDAAAPAADTAAAPPADPAAPPAAPG